MTDKITMTDDTQATIAAMREGADALGRIAASLWGDTAKAHKKAQATILTAAADRMEREAGLPTREDELRAAYVAGASAVHNYWAGGGTAQEADFGEAASDYAIDVALARMEPSHED